MPSPGRRNRPVRRLGLALAALVTLFGLMAASIREPLARTGADWAIAPVRTAVDWVSTQWHGLTQSVAEIKQLQAENAVLREQVRTGAQAEAHSLLLEPENQRLRADLLLKGWNAYPLLTAEVIDRQADTWYRTFMINRGSRDGVSQHMAVINGQGLVGKVLETGPDTAVVQLLLDDGGPTTGGFAAGAKLADGTVGYVNAEPGGHLRVTFSVSNLQAGRGQPVLTSGLGILPPDLVIGYIDSAAAASLQNSFALRPAVDVHKLAVVHVVLYRTDMDRAGNAP
jgi:rod shape-determining protein MreC